VGIELRALSPVTRRGASSDLLRADGRMVLRAVPLVWKAALAMLHGARRNFYTESSY